MGNRKMISDINLEGLRDLVRTRMEQGEISYRAAASACGVNISHLNRFILGRPPSTLNFCRLCDWVGVDPRTLYITPAPARKAGITRKEARP